MLTYALRRSLLAVFTLFVITMLIYALIRSMPGTPLTIDQEATDPGETMSKQDLELATQAYGLDKPWFVAYFHWLGNLTRLDLGASFRYRTAVTTLIAERLGTTLLLSVPSFLLTYALAIPIGLYVTRHSGTFRERLISVILYMFYSLPTYVCALWLLYWFYLRMDGTWFELPIGLKSDNFDDLSLPAKAADLARHMILPLFCYSYSALAFDTRFIKANMEEAIRQDYIRTARAKGLDDRTILFRHAFRNTLIPFVTIIGISLPGLITGAIILEQIFSLPGIGKLFIDSVTFRDYTVIMGLTFMFSAATLLGQLVADLLYAWVDPRITYQ
jgi:peptide/nickel transport system permease protein